MTMDLAYLAIMLMILEYALFMTLVGFARGWYKIAAPAVTGNADFERYFRVQQNTLEQLIAVIPALWIMALTLSALWAALLGCVFVAARGYYAYGYYKSAGGRHYGFLFGSWAAGALILGACIGIVNRVLVSSHQVVILRCKGSWAAAKTVWPARLVVSGRAPARIRNSAVSAWVRSAARCSGVLPFTSCRSSRAR